MAALGLFQSCWITITCILAVLMDSSMNFSVRILEVENPLSRPLSSIIERALVNLIALNLLYMEYVSVIFVKCTV